MIKHMTASAYSHVALIVKVCKLLTAAGLLMLSVQEPSEEILKQYYITEEKSRDPNRIYIWESVWLAASLE